ncbi:MAG: hypothetical protein GY874_06175 [Desulfobacteraceae bacterium]|nr:hypothetical protein [Desulfobacteraceae bacterium]
MPIAGSNSSGTEYRFKNESSSSTESSTDTTSDDDQSFDYVYNNLTITVPCWINDPDEIEKYLEDPFGYLGMDFDSEATYTEDNIPDWVPGPEEDTNEDGVVDDKDELSDDQKEFLDDPVKYAINYINETTDSIMEGFIHTGQLIVELSPGYEDITSPDLTKDIDDEDEVTT